MQKTKEAEIRYEEQRRVLISNLGSISNQIAQNTHINNVLLGIKGIMIGMMDKLRSGQILPDDIPTFDELYAQVEKEINDSSTES
jgi:hypothetical protein